MNTKQERDRAAIWIELLKSGKRQSCIISPNQAAEVRKKLLCNTKSELSFEVQTNAAVFSSAVLHYLHATSSNQFTAFIGGSSQQIFGEILLDEVGNFFAESSKTQMPISLVSYGEKGAITIDLPAPGETGDATVSARGDFVALVDYLEEKFPDGVRFMQARRQKTEPI